ncbi:GNAT family N-acetyltransferase [Candidatus Woesearchaeota archaeon]|nr:GNAT family N-acetyltransferase [Candidatus Woesearchaeota archaeon]
MSKNNNIQIRLIKNKKELEQVFRIREIIFIREQKVQKNIERDEFDKISKHVIILYKNKPVGCARIRLIGKKAKLERIALLKGYRGRGFGKNIVNYLIKYCKKKDIKEICMNSQYYLKNYYKKFGFKTRGKTFMEAGIKHIEMYLN